MQLEKKQKDNAQIYNSWELSQRLKNSKYHSRTWIGLGIHAIF